MRSERGSALVMALMAAALLSVLALALSVLTTTEMLIASSYAMGQELFYAAESGLEIGERELARLPDWDAVLGGRVQSAWIDGDAAVARVLEDGSQVRLDEATNLANCGKPGPCSAADITTVSDARPWGPNNPQWRLFSWGQVNHAIVAVWIGDDPAENDDNPLVDGLPATNPGAGIVAVRSEAFGAGGGHRILQATVRRLAGPSGATRLSWAQIR